MCPHGHSSIDRVADRTDTAQKLHCEPYPENNNRRYPNQKNEDERQDPIVWLQDNVGPQYPGNGATCSQGGNMGIEIEGYMHESGADTAGEIKQQIAQVPELRLDVVAENPKEKHVAQKMWNAGMQKHTGQQRQERCLKASVPTHPDGNAGWHHCISQFHQLYGTGRNEA